MTLGVLGLGRLGKFTMELAKPFFKEVIAYDPYLPSEKWPSNVRNVSLNEIFQVANVITLHLPLSPETNQIVNKEVLNQIPERGVYLVNTARGGLIDLDAALDCLNQGRLLGIGLDVMPVEPPPIDHPILNHPRSIVTPHTAWYSEASVIDLRQKFAKNVVDWAKHGVAPNAVIKGR
jgi:D-3-phosphoglycerate dehydrogenase